MILEHIGLSQINGSLVVLDDVKGVQYDEMVELHLDDGSTRVGRVVRVDGDRCVIQVFEGTRGLSLVNNRTVLTGHPMMMDLSPELLGRVLDGLGRPSTASVTFTRRPPRCQRRAHQPRQPRLPPQLHPHRHFLHRLPGHADPRPEAADLLRLRHEA